MKNQNNYHSTFVLDKDGKKWSWDYNTFHIDYSDNYEFIDVDNLCGMMQQIYAIKKGWAQDCGCFDIDMYWWECKSDL